MRLPSASWVNVSGVAGRKAGRVISVMASSPLTATFNASSQQLLIDVDRDKAETLGVAVQDVYGTLQTMFGSLYVSQFNKFSRLWQVIVQAEPSYRLTPEDLERVYVRSKAGAMVPLKAVVTTRYVTGPSIVTRFNNFPAVKITANAAPGYSTGQAIAALEEVGTEALPDDYAVAWTGQAFEEKKSGSASSARLILNEQPCMRMFSTSWRKSLSMAVASISLRNVVFGSAFEMTMRA